MKRLRFPTALLLAALLAHFSLAQNPPDRPADQDRPTRQRTAQDRPATQDRAADQDQARGRSAEPKPSETAPPQDAAQGGGRRGPSGNPTVTRVIRLQNSNCKPIFEVVNTIFRGSVVICGDNATRTIILGAYDDDTLRKTCELIAELDKPAPAEAAPTPQEAGAEIALEYVSLKLCRADDLVRHLIPIAHTYGFDEIVVLADERSNTLCLCGSQAGVKKLVAVAREFDDRAAAAIDGSNAAQQTRFIALKHADAKDVAQLLSHYFAQLNRRVPVLADDASGQIIAHATEAEAQLIMKIVESLDVPPRASAARGARTQPEPK